MTAEPPAGTIGVVSTRHAGTWTGRLASWAIQFDTESPCNHAFVALGGGRIIEARPGGAGYNAWDAYPGTIWLRSIPLPAKPPAAVQAAAATLLGVPYGWLDIAAVGIAQKRWDPLLAQRWDDGHEPWWVRRAARPDRLICSQLADLLYQRLGRYLFPASRLPGLVAPGDLWRLGGSPAA